MKVHDPGCTSSLTRLSRSALLLVLSALLAGCLEEEKESTSYVAYNHTDEGIVSIIVNGEGGILHAEPQSGGGQMCCVILPKKWRPGLTARIKWRVDGDWLKDETGKEIIRNGKRVYVPAPWKERTVEVPKYEREMGWFYIHFLPNDEVKVAVTRYGPGRAEHPYHFEKYRSEYERRRAGN